MTFFNQTDEDRAVKKNRNIILDSSRGSASSLSSEKNNDFDFLRCSAILRDSCHSAACYCRSLLQITTTLSIWKFRKKYWTARPRVVHYKRHFETNFNG